MPANMGEHSQAFRLLTRINLGLHRFLEVTAADPFASVVRYTQFAEGELAFYIQFQVHSADEAL